MILSLFIAESNLIMMNFITKSFTREKCSDNERERLHCNLDATFYGILRVKSQNFRRETRGNIMSNNVEFQMGTNKCGTQWHTVFFYSRPA